MNIISKLLFKLAFKRFSVPFLCIVVILSRIFYPNIQFDNISLWLFLILAISLLIPDIGDLISRIRKIKIGDNEIELTESLNNLSKRTEEVENATQSDKSLGKVIELQNSDIYDKLIGLTDNPRAALVNLAIEIEKILRELAINHKVILFGNYLSPIRVIDELVNKQVIPQELSFLIRDFWSIRNKAVHGHDLELTDRQLYSLIDLGVRIISLLSVKSA